MKKLLIINDLVNDGGVEKLTQLLANKLSEQDYAVSVLTFVNNSNFHSYFSKRVRHIRLDRCTLKSGSLFIRIFNRIVRTIQKEWFQRTKRFDGVIAMKEGSCMILAAALTASKKIGFVHTDYQAFHWTETVFSNSRQNELNCMKQFDRVFCVSDAVRRSVAQKVGDPLNLRVLYNPVDRGDILSKATEPAALFKGGKNPAFVCVGGLRKEKGYNRLLEACRRLNEEGYRYQVTLMGAGTEEETLKAFARENGLHNVFFAGHQNNPYPTVKQADWFVCSSYSESFCLAVHEAAALGVPVISTDCGGIRELFRPEYGILAENSTDGIYRGMKQALDDPALSARLKEALQNGMDDPFTVDRWLQAIKTELNRPVPKRTADG